MANLPTVPGNLNFKTFCVQARLMAGGTVVLAPARFQAAGVFLFNFITRPNPNRLRSLPLDG